MDCKTTNTVPETTTQKLMEESPPPMITVIVPSYNQATLLIQTLENLLQQSYCPLEIIVVDNGSTDQTQTLLQPYHERIRYFYQENDGRPGHGRAINTGIEAARGEYIHCLAAGDRVTPEYYALAIQAFQQAPNIGAVATDAYRPNEQGDAMEILQAGHFKTQQEFLLEALAHNPIIASTMMVKGFCYEAVGLRRSQFEMADDYDHWLRIGSQFEIAYLKTPQVSCRVPAATFSRHTAKMWNLERQVVGEFRRRTAIETFFPELRQQPNDERYGQAHERIGRIFAGRGWHEEATQEFEKANSYRVRASESTPPFETTLSGNGRATWSGEAKPVRHRPGGTVKARLPLRILMALHDFVPHSFAGTEIHTFHLAQALQAAGHDVRILQACPTQAQPEGHLSETQYEGLTVYSLATHSKDFISTFRNDAITQAFAAFLDDHPFDLIHFQHLLHLGAGPLEVAKKKGIPMVLTLNDFWFLCHENHLIQARKTGCSGPETVDKCAECFIQSRTAHLPQLTAEDKAGIFQILAYRREYLRPFLSLPDRVLAPSRYVQRLFDQYALPAERITVLPLGIQTNDRGGPRRSRDQSVLRFAFLGNIAPIKGLETIIRAFKPLGSQAELHIYGKISDPTYAKQVLQEATDCKHIVYHGAYRPESLPEILSGVDAIVLASLSESYSLVVREAFRAGVPVIAPPVGGIPEIVYDGVNGMLFQPANVADLREKIERISANPALLDQLRAGIPRVRTITAEAEDLQTIYWQLVEAKRMESPQTRPPLPLTSPFPQGSVAASTGAPEATSADPVIHPIRRRPTPSVGPADSNPDAIQVALYTLDLMQWACPTIRFYSPLMGSPLAHRFQLLPGTSIENVGSGRTVHVDRSCLENAHVVVLQRNVAGLDGLPELIARAKNLHKPVIYEIDDNLLGLPAGHPQKPYYDSHRERIIRTAAQADLVTVSTQKLREVFLRYNSKVAVLPNLIDLSLWSEPPSPRQDERVTLVYMGTPTHDEDLAVVAPAIKNILQKYQGRVVLRFWGYVPPVFRHLAGVESIGQMDNNYMNFARNFRRATFDIALAPLADHEFNRCKSPIKYLEYAACRLPGVYSRLEPYSESVRPEVTGLLAGSDPQEWVAALDRLIEDESFRRALGENAYWDVVSQHSVAARYEEWTDLYINLAQKAAPSAWSPVTLAVSSAASEPARTTLQPAASGEVKKVSIIIPVFNQAAYTRDCLEALWANTQYTNYEVLVVDNGSTDETPQMLAAYRGKIKLIRNETNLGFAKACNQGARAARGEHLVFLNNDTLPQPSWLDALVALVEQEPQAAVIGAKLLYKDDTIQHAGVIFSASARLPYHLYRHFDKDHPAVSRIREFPVVTGACMLVRRGVFFEAGLFDESYMNCYEDVDLCMKVQELGYKVLYNPLSVVYHFESVTEGRRDRQNLERSYSVLCRKWDHKIPADEGRYYAEDNLSFEYIDAHNLKISPASEAEQRLNRARALKSQGQFQEALRTFAGVTEERHRFDVCMLKGDCLAHLEQTEAAAAEYQAARQLDPQSERPHIGLAVLAVGRGRFEEARDCFQTALALNAQNDNALCGLGIALAHLGRTEEALEKYRQALNVNAKNITALSNLQALCYEQKNFALAQDYFSRYLAMCPTDLAVRIGLAGTYILKGDSQKARETLHHVLKLDPSHKEAATLLSTLDMPAAASS